jgi:hypothetical protein
VAEEYLTMETNGTIQKTMKHTLLRNAADLQSSLEVEKTKITQETLIISLYKINKQFKFYLVFYLQIMWLHNGLTTPFK